jgi:hypothetical protein
MTGTAITLVMIFLGAILLMARQTIGILFMIYHSGEPFFHVLMTIDTRIAIIILVTIIGVAGLTSLFIRVLMDYTIKHWGENVVKTVTF